MPLSRHIEILLNFKIFEQWKKTINQRNCSLSRLNKLMTPVGQTVKQFEVMQRMANMYTTSTIVPELIKEM